MTFEEFAKEKRKEFIEKEYLTLQYLLDKIFRSDTETISRNLLKLMFDHSVLPMLKEAWEKGKKELKDKQAEDRIGKYEDYRHDKYIECKRCKENFRNPFRLELPSKNKKYNYSYCPNCNK